MKKIDIFEIIILILICFGSKLSNALILNNSTNSEVELYQVFNSKKISLSPKMQSQIIASDDFLLIPVNNKVFDSRNYNRRQLNNPDFNLTIKESEGKFKLLSTE